MENHFCMMLECSNMVLRYPDEMNRIYCVSCQNELNNKIIDTLVE